VAELSFSDRPVWTPELSLVIGDIAGDLKGERGPSDDISDGLIGGLDTSRIGEALASRHKGARNGGARRRSLGSSGS
jgi:hypothetical protein